MTRLGDADMKMSFEKVYVNPDRTSIYIDDVPYSLKYDAKRNSCRVEIHLKSGRIRSFSGKTPEIVARNIQRAMYLDLRDMNLRECNMTFQEWFQIFEKLDEIAVSVRIKNVRRDQYYKLIIPFFDNIRLQEINEDDIEIWLAELTATIVDQEPMGCSV